MSSKFRNVFLVFGVLVVVIMLFAACIAVVAGHLLH